MDLARELSTITLPKTESLRRCARCVYDVTVPGIKFNENGVCNYCAMHDEMEANYPTGKAGEQKLQTIVSQIKAAGKGKKYDVIVGVSGGCDSSYMLHLAKKVYGLRPLAVHFDNTWDSTIAVENIQRMLKVLDVDLYTYVVDNVEYDDIYLSFLKAGLPDIEAPTDIGLATVLYIAAEKFGIEYMLEGHSFRTEGISPLGWLYMDGKYIQSVHKEFGTVKMKSYPNLWLSSFIKWTLFLSVKKIRPLYWVDYNKEEIKKFLAKEYGWQWYGGHHLENRFTEFYHTYFMPRRFGMDGRLLGYSAQVRSGELSRAEALALVEKPVDFDPSVVEMVKKRLKLSNDEFERLMNLPKRSYREFKNYKRTFERLRPFWWLMLKLNRVPKSFYMKFALPHNT